MTAAGKITVAHLERLAIVYVRQSTIAQVREHTESTARQYALAQEAARLGWNAARISIIDADLGVSGRTASARSGVKELVGRVVSASARWERVWDSKYRAWRGVQPTYSACSNYVR